MKHRDLTYRNVLDQTPRLSCCLGLFFEVVLVITHDPIVEVTKVRLIFLCRFLWDTLVILSPPFLSCALGLLTLVCQIIVKLFDVIFASYLNLL